MSKTILVVEDFKTTRDVIRHTLEKQGYKVLEASHGREAVKFLDGTPINLIITDYNMPEMNGAELVDYIRQTSEYTYVPILMLSTDTSEEKKQNALVAGATGWIKKPFEVVNFLKIVEKILQT
jgi:two-component system, chemotaxis family, chemotaxis protein CheY